MFRYFYLEKKPKHVEEDVELFPLVEKKFPLAVVGVTMPSHLVFQDFSTTPSSLISSGTPSLCKLINTFAWRAAEHLYTCESKPCSPPNPNPSP